MSGFVQGLRVLLAKEGLRDSESQSEGPPPDWDEFMREMYDGGKRRIPNPNPETRDTYHDVSISTALKYPNVMKSVMREYRAWQKKRSDKVDESSRKVDPTQPPPNDPKVWNDLGETFNATRREYSQSEKDAIRFYSEDLGYRLVNDILRGGQDPSDDLYADHLRAMSEIPKLDEAFKKSKTSRDLVVSRGLGKNAPLARLLAEGKLEIGTIQVDAGYTSTSLKPPEANDWPHDIMMTIRVPEGTQVIYLGPPPGPDTGRGAYSESPEEYELLLNRRAKLRVIGFDPEKKHIEMEVIP